MKYNDNGTYKDIYIKSFDTLPIGTEVDYDGDTAPTGWTEISEVITGTLEMASPTNITGTATYYKYGRIVCIQGELKVASGSSSAWQSYTVSNLPEIIYPLATTVVDCVRDVDGKIMAVAVSSTSNTLYISSRGRASLTTDNTNVIPYTLIYISAN